MRNALMAVVCLSVCPVPDHKSRMEGHSEFSQDTGDRWPRLEVENSKGKVTRPINAITENQPYLHNGKAYELQTWYTDGVRW